MLSTTLALRSGCSPVDHPGDKVVIVVGSRHISVSELKRDLAFLFGKTDNFARQGLVNEPLLNQITNHYLIVEYARENGLSVSQEELKAVIKDIKRDYPNDTFKEALLRGYTDIEEWGAFLKERLLVDKVMKSLIQKINPPKDQEIKQYYLKNQEEFRHPDRLRFRQIVTSARKEAKTILDRLRKGEKFKDLAIAFSIGPEGADGGKIDWIARGQLEQTMEKALFAMPQGKISSIIKTPYGYHIFEVLDVQPEGVTKFSDAVGEEIAAKILAQKREAFYTKWVKELKKHFSVKINKKNLSLV
jgi:parvulin-like peptidyl-prolyl isomerase